MAPTLNQPHPIQFTELAALLPPEMRGDAANLKVSVSYRVEKFEGEPGEGKVPFEVIEGGDDRPTTIYHPRE